MPPHTFKSPERLKSRKLIQAIFSRGKSSHVYPIRIVWIKSELPTKEFPVQFALTVPKRRFPKAVSRNRIRRKLREAYRVNKYYLYDKLKDHPHQYGIMMLYTGTEEVPFPQIEKSIQRLLRKFLRSISNDGESS